MASNQTFFQRNRAYLYTALGLGVVGILFVGVLMIMDWGYLIAYTLQVVTGGGIAGVLTPPATHYEAMVNAAFGPAYTSIAPEIIRASNERQLFIWYVFVAEIAIFAWMYAKYGRKAAVITKPEDTVQVFTPFQRAVIWLNVAIMVVLIITGFNITWAMRSEGGALPYFLRGMHEVTGLVWFPIWLLASIMTFKDSPILRKNSTFAFFLPGEHKPMKRVIWFFFVAMGAGLLLSGFLIWLMHPSSITHAEVIQFKRALLYLHFGASVLIMFFVLDFVYSAAVAVKGNLGYLWSGRFPREHLEQLDPEVLADLKSVGRA
ncbi:MAG: cytochrome b/b6 domain-containing protein [Campylobacterales bacterium]